MKIKQLKALIASLPDDAPVLFHTKGCFIGDNYSENYMPIGLADVAQHSKGSGFLNKKGHEHFKYQEKALVIWTGLEPGRE